jgi:hypothetical protein
MLTGSVEELNLKARKLKKKRQAVAFSSRLFGGANNRDAPRPVADFDAVQFLARF